MRTTHHSGHDLAIAGRVFNMAITAVGGLYLATHSIVVTMAGAATACLLACWVLWSAYQRDRNIACSEAQRLDMHADPDRAHDAPVSENETRD